MFAAFLAQFATILGERIGNRVAEEAVKHFKLVIRAQEISAEAQALEQEWKSAESDEERAAVLRKFSKFAGF